MKFTVIAILFALIILTLIAFLLRRKHIQQIGKLEQQKLQIQHKPIFEEMTKIKQLNMTGETEEKFESWRAEWTEVMDVHMPEIDSLLFDVEEQVDRFRYGKATKIETTIEMKIDDCETKMKRILAELNELVGSEEKNRVEMDKLKEQHRAARKKVLAHQHSFGAAVGLLEKELESFNEKFAEYDELTENGNYLQAREIVIALNEKGENVFTLVEQIPILLVELQNKIPAALRELRNGMREMESQAYYLDHLQLPQRFKEIEMEVEEMIAHLAQLKMDAIQSETEKINEEIESFYDALEHEVIAKHFVTEHIDAIGEKLAEEISLMKEVAEEAAYVQQSYRLNEDEAKIPRDCLQRLSGLAKRFEIIEVENEQASSAYTSSQEELQAITQELEFISGERTSFAERIKNLRNDENKVRMELERLSSKLQDVDRSLHKGNIPGIPDDMEARLEEADEQIYIVQQSLEEVPLNMSLIHSYLENAKQSIDEVSEKAKELLENVMLIEWIIQYGNRYRASNPEMHARLLEAEESFRQFRYAKALEEAATAVEDIEPGAMKRIEELVEENN